MKSLFPILSLLACLSSCGGPDVAPQDISRFTCSDVQLADAYAWAHDKALSYSHDGGGDPVGPWYEAALPQREAFCMRDVSHQAVAGEMLGLRCQNRNMMTCFVKNISESKDWCTYWEIDRRNRPAPVDYRNDDEFWYNLNANFDLVTACLRLYDWTGDDTYLQNPHFAHFYARTFGEYIQKWQLQPDSLLLRSTPMNAPAAFDPSDNFHTCRGLASYIENFRSLTMSADLIAALIGGYEARARMARIGGDMTTAVHCTTAAKHYRAVLDAQWWDDPAQEYHSFWSSDGVFHSGEAAAYLLWFDAVARPDRVRAVVKSMDKYDWNVENQSHFPALFYRLGYPEKAYEVLVGLPAQPRADYPEVSFGVVEGVIGGVMGICPDAAVRRVDTQFRLGGADQWARAEDVPLWAGYITVGHLSPRVTEFTNRTGRALTWRAVFAGRHSVVRADGKSLPAVTRTDPAGNVFSFADVVLDDGKTCRCEV